jgi:hypothetical protein
MRWTRAGRRGQDRQQSPPPDDRNQGLQQRHPVPQPRRAADAEGEPEPGQLRLVSIPFPGQPGGLPDEDSPRTDASPAPRPERTRPPAVLHRTETRFAFSLVRDRVIESDWDEDLYPEADTEAG